LPLGAGGVLALGKASRAALRVSFLDMILRRAPLCLAFGDSPNDISPGHDAHELERLRHR
jgi:hypothetical protein